ncbi:MAG: ion transporter, partial [Aquiluna sp.]
MPSADSRQSRLLTPADENQPAYRVAWLTKIVYGNAFELTLVAIILINAGVLAWLTLPNVQPETRALLESFDRVVIWVYLAELLVRIASYGKKPWMFFTTGWNVFDFLVIALIPVFQGQTVVLRLLRLLRVVRLFRFLPEFRLLTTSITRSMPPLISVGVLIVFLLFIYAMAGHYLFGEALPGEWGDVGVAMESLFILLTLENFPSYFYSAMDVSPAALPFFLSYVFVIVFTVLNVLVGIVINAMQEARDEDKRKRNGESTPHGTLLGMLSELEA